MTAVPALFDLAATLSCGQCFRWDEGPDGVFTGVACGRRLAVCAGEAPAPNALTLAQAAQDEGWRSYFDLDRDYEGIRRELSERSEVLSRAAAFAPGIRILNQEPWEALCSFIISQNNNIPRIKGIVARLCEAFGAPLPGGGYSFPGPEALAGLSPEDLAPLRCGFRARYIIDAAQKVGGGLALEQLRGLPLPEARSALMTITGVGEKVADCTLLYGLHRLDAFPMDVWMKRAMAALFPGKTPEDFGPCAGIAQQYIFHYSRCHPDLF